MELQSEGFEWELRPDSRRSKRESRRDMRYCQPAILAIQGWRRVAFGLCGAPTLISRGVRLG